jgi:hypothetical protein
MPTSVSYRSLVLLALVACSTPAADAPPAPEPAEAPAPTAPAEPAPAPEAQPTFDVPDGARRVVAIGDLHADRSAALHVLQLAGVADARGHWTGGDTVLVQTGDTTDRGPDSRGVIDLMRQLQEEAPEAGGEVHLLLGNHEVMNLQGDWRYVSPGDLASFGGRDKRVLAFKKSGEYGGFLATLPMAVKVDDTVFVHGGITPEMAELGIDGINARARKHLFDPPGPDGDAVHGPNGPTWYRGYVQDPEEKACPTLEKALDLLDAERMVVGHTTRRDGEVETRCDGRLAVIDIGISAHYGGNLGAWESLDGDARVRYPDGPADLPDPPADGEAAKTPSP